MPERPDRVHVATRHGLVEISWDAREAIRDELRDLDSARTTVAAFEGVGASRPVELTRGGKVDVLGAIHAVLEARGGDPRIEPGLVELRDRLASDLDTAD